MSIVGFGALWSILLILVGGWIALRSRSLEPIIWSESGYNLYFKIAAAGLLWFLICIVAFTYLGFSSVVALSCPGDSHIATSPGVAAFFRFFYRCNGEIFMVASWAAPFVGLLVFVLFSRLSRFARLVIKWRLKNIFREKEFEKIVWQAIDERNMLLITLDSHKAYIGWPADTFDFSQPDTAKKHLRIIPMMSGYRDSAMNLTITTDYLATLGETSSSNQEKYRKLLAVVIPVEKIASLQNFDLDLYDSFQRQNRPAL